MGWKVQLTSAMGLLLAVGSGLASDEQGTLAFIEYRPISINTLREQAEPTTRISLPYFLPSKHGIVADRINHVLYSGEAAVAVPDEAEAASPKTVHQRTDSDFYEYSILRNDKKVLSLEIHIEGCPSSCEVIDKYYNFEAETGRYIPLSLLFTRAGLRNLSKPLIRKWSKDIRVQLDEGSDECIASMVRNYRQEGSYTGYHFLLGKDGITFRRGGCGKMDGPYSMTFKTAELGYALSAYGRYILLDGEHTPQPLSIRNQFLEGRIGNKYEFKMQLFETYPSAGYATGTYYYKKYKKDIRVVALEKGNTIEISEDQQLYSMRNQKMVATAMGAEYVGYWTDGKKKLDFRARIGAP